MISAGTGCRSSPANGAQFLASTSRALLSLSDAQTPEGWQVAVCCQHVMTLTASTAQPSIAHSCMCQLLCYAGTARHAALDPCYLDDTVIATPACQ